MWKSLAVIKIITTFAPAKLKGDALVAQLVEHLTLNQGVQGSSPCRRTKAFQVVVERDNALVAQLVEHLTLNQGVQGSSPCRRTERRQTRNCQSPFSLKTLKHQGDISVILAFLCNFTLLKRNSQNAQ